MSDSKKINKLYEEIKKLEAEGKVKEAKEKRRKLQKFALND